MSSLTTGPFQNLSATWARLMQLTPQQMANASAPDYLKIAAIDAQNNIRQQGQPAAGPAAPPVAQQIVDKSVGAPPAGQAMPAPQAPTQMAARGGYIHDYGVASLPYEANYGHGGIVSFAEGGEPEAKAEDPEGFVQQLKTAINENPTTAKVIAGAGTLASFKLPGLVGKAWGLLPPKVKKNIVEYAKKAIIPSAVVGAGVGAESYLASRLNAPAAEPVGIASDTALAGEPVVTGESEDPGLGIAGLGGGAPNLDRTMLPEYVPRVVPKAQSAEQLQADQDRVNNLYGLGKDFYEQEKAQNEAKLSALEAERKGVFSGQGLMDFGAALSAQEGSNFLDNFSKAIPAYTGAVKEGNQYSRSRQELLDTRADLLRGQQRGEARSDAANTLAAEKASAAEERALNEANRVEAYNAKVAQVELDQKRAIALAELANSALDRGSREAIATIGAAVRAQAGGGRGLTANQRIIAFQKYSETAAPAITALLDEKKTPKAAQAPLLNAALMEGFRKLLDETGVSVSPIGTSSNASAGDGLE